MELRDVDRLLEQWVLWSANPLGKLDASRSRWQSEVRDEYPEIGKHAEYAMADDQSMLLVDQTLALLKREDVSAYVILIDTYRNHKSYHYSRLEYAQRSFISHHIESVDNDDLRSIPFLRGRRSRRIS